MNAPASSSLILFEDEHLLVVNKPAGWNTHSPNPFAGEGLYEWLRNRESKWAKLAIVHRLDQETSGVILFGKTPIANRSLTAQFSAGAVRKKYLLVSDRPVLEDDCTVRDMIVRAGQKYVSRPQHAGGDHAATSFTVRERRRGHTLVEANPLTGRTHQIRVHAAARGFPILGDTLYGGTPAHRVQLHAESITLHHPTSRLEMNFAVPVDFSSDTRVALRQALFADSETNAFRVLHGAADGWRGWYLERWGEFLLSQSMPQNSRRERAGPSVRNKVAGLNKVEQTEVLQGLFRSGWAQGVYHQNLLPSVQQPQPPDLAPKHILGTTAADRFSIRENGLSFEISFKEGHSVGLFLDQRANRRRLLNNYVAPGFPAFPSGLQGKCMLNLFAYTCAFSVCAAQGGAMTTSIDLSKKYLNWGQRNFELNSLDSAGHEFIAGDAFEWCARLRKRQQTFDIVILDPPTFSRSKQRGIFRAERDYPRLLSAALPVLAPGGILFASTNASRVQPETFVKLVQDAVRSSGREILQQHYSPQPPDFPITREEPAYLKTIWLRLS